MPGALRSRLRRVLTGQEGEGGIAAKIKHGKHPKPAQPESDFYLPGEKMPPMKYRRPVDPEHKKNLDAFSFKKAWRRRSHQSLYSPMGSRLPSRKGSFRSRRSRSRSVHRSRRSSFHSDYDEDDETWVDSGIGASLSDSDRPANIREASDDEGDVLNVGLSRNPTQDPRDAPRKESTGARRRSSSAHSVRPSSTRPATGSDRTRGDSQPFSPEDLELALQKSHLDAKKLEATKEEPDRSNGCPDDDDDDDDASPFDNLRPRGGSIFIPQDAESPGLFPGWNFVSSPTKGGPSYLPPNDATPIQFERRESIFVSKEEPSFFPRPGSLDAESENAPQTGRRGSTFAPDEADAVAPLAAAEPPKRKPVVSCPSEEIMKILARRD
ncbi:uncharacterized protein EKO05_0007098 [Ascochyta rabiei]|uniref:Uncharacterized protein n=1 Tax=Didymella rabiei TaxID=5454 RepID=A0A163G5R0_DIDRA|nr:uncharacterized protein EKO05_0007098 [Ascochyta rabiei]KZM24691.1 hypothetical protein ST47_g4155 [Ascochyta rabiei]UPX16710.1 hypothetical protein EKO05_0007098 [Ascochyta rabiei]